MKNEISFKKSCDLLKEKYKDCYPYKGIKDFETKTKDIAIWKARTYEGPVVIKEKDKNHPSKMKSEIRLIKGKYVLVKLIKYKTLHPVEAAGLVNKGLVIDTTGKFLKLGKVQALL
jgi:hypothetical protein